MNTRSVWQHADFRKLWFGQTISAFGSQVGGGALRLTAILLLGSGAFELGLLTIAAYAPTLLFGLFAGVWVDRLPRRPLLVAADLSRAALLVIIPLAYFAGMLRIEILYLVAGLVGILNILFEIAYHAFVPQLIERDQLVDGNSKLGISGSVAEIAGPPLGGLLVQAISAPLAILVDALSFVFSAVAIGATKAEDRVEIQESTNSTLREVVDGLVAVGHTPVLRGLLLATAMQSLAGGMIGTLYDLYLIRDLHFSPAVVGLTIGVGGISALFGALITPRIVQRFGEYRTLIGSMLFSLAGFLLVTAYGWWALPLVLLAQSTDIARAIQDITALSMRQSATNDRLLGRVNAAFSVAPAAALLLGALFGGALAEHFGARLGIAIGVVANLVAIVWVWNIPVDRESAAPKQEILHDN